MAPVTADQVQLARAEGHTAGYGHAPPSPNPYAPPFVPVWLGPRTAAERAKVHRAQRPARILAHVWMAGYRQGQAAYAAERGLRPASG
jgi:hypothetical protein